MASSNDTPAKRSEYKQRLEEKLTPRRDVILFIASAIYGERPHILAALIVGSYFVLSLLFLLIQTFSAVTLTCLGAGAILLRWKRKGTQAPGVLDAIKYNPVPSSPVHPPSFEEIIQKIISFRFAVSEKIHCLKESLASPRGTVILLQLLGLLLFISLLGRLFTTFWLVWLSLVLTISYPAFIGHRIHQKIGRILKPHWEKVQPKVEPHLKTVDALVTKHTGFKLLECFQGCCAEDQSKKKD